MVLTVGVPLCFIVAVTMLFLGGRCTAAHAKDGHRTDGAQRQHGGNGDQLLLAQAATQAVERALLVVHREFHVGCASGAISRGAELAVDLCSSAVNLGHRGVVLAADLKPGALGIEGVQEAELAELEAGLGRLVSTLRTRQHLAAQRFDLVLARLQEVCHLQHFRAQAQLLGLGVGLRGVPATQSLQLGALVPVKERKRHRHAEHSLRPTQFLGAAGTNAHSHVRHAFGTSKGVARIGALDLKQSAAHGRRIGQPRHDVGR
mmetsp:Transcript_12857/g.30152  ORF Transcript_12857/g.30152 Transcript_12857/m.30152 type:complete len:261 (-) Transcript_12857:2259-3041(-)